MVRSIKNLIAAILIAISGYLAWTSVLPKYDSFSVLKSVIEARTETLETRKDILQKIQGVKNNYEERFYELQRLALVIPEKEQLPEFISTMEDIFSKTGVVLEGIRLGRGASKVEGTRSIGFEISFDATYETALTFLTYLEKNIRLIDVNLLSIGEASGEASADPNLLGIQIKGVTYYLQPVSEIKASAPRAPADTQ